ncbi:hypothetical protein CBE01nite_33090 [Clostridium beijerinckii]|uniref:Oligosaccharide flippase family protein n=1 Tax=Clostridium beijerinckii TaxID=1520 RepID=A0AB74VIG7_CLOBE|nr:oligosaccharide flippase family protein [Clostridium beijerinckii]NRZ25601.1 O-antigen/teichoic acid export membrane protein [Clostridium beijerinckii]NYB98116.1 O-antigen/teichoic acid export membrane protein [Clostridium beijerinckii]OOM23269.1 polysaccharide biosynthesis protein [Clostridium beijerinckii]QUN36353.1 oligosaccharide flippase family protein [Clostridium beijerinckii]SQB12937.1 polysaccharide transporter [Clostridium beijerinckii]
MREKIIRLIKKYEGLSEPVKASFWFTICNVLNKGIALLATPIFTRMLTTEQYGDYTVFQSWYGILIIFGTCNLFIGVYGKGLVEFDKDKDKYTSSLLALTTVITIVTLVIYALNIDFWTRFLGLSPIIMTAMFIQLFTMPAYEFWTTKLRFEYKYKALIGTSIGMSVMSILISVIAVLSTSYKLEARVYSDVFVKAVVGIFIFVLLVLRGKKLFHKKYWKYALVFNIPLIPHFLSTMILNQSDRIMIKNMVDASSAAMYGIAYVIGTVVLLVTNAINNSFTPYTYQALKENNFCGIKKNANTLLILAASMVCVSIIFAPEIIYIFAGSNYYEAIGVIPPVSASVFFIFMYSLFSNIEYYYKKTTYISISSIICAIINVVLNYLFIPRFGYYAAGYTTLVCYILYATIHFLFCYSILKQKNIRLTDIFDIKRYVFITFFVLVVMMIMVIIYKYMIIRYSILLSALFIAWIKKEWIIKEIKDIQR